MNSWVEHCPRLHLHIVPSLSAWEAEIRDWFGQITNAYIGNKVYRSVEALRKSLTKFKINQFSPHVRFHWQKVKPAYRRRSWSPEEDDWFFDDLSR